MNIVPMDGKLFVESKPCVKWGYIQNVYVSLSDGSIRCTVLDGDSIIDAGFYFNCQHWIYNRLLPGMSAADTGYSSFCLGDPVIVYTDVVGNFVMGIYDKEHENLLVHQYCWPVFDPSIAFAVVPVDITNSSYSWGAPFVVDGGDGPFDFVEPFVDGFGETRPLGTYRPISSTSRTHARLITSHTSGANVTLIAHTMHEFFRTFTSGVFLCPVTTENSRYFLGRKLGYNSTMSRLVIDDIARVSGIVDNGALNAITLAQDGDKIFVLTFSKLIDRIQNLAYLDGMPRIELSVGYMERGRVDHLFCITKLIAAGGEESIIDLPEYGYSSVDSVEVDKYLVCVPNVGSAVVSQYSGMRLIFFSFSINSYITASHNYEMLVEYDASNANLASVTVTEQHRLLWEPRMTGGGVTGSIYYVQADFQNEQLDFVDISCEASTLTGPDYPACIGGDHTLTAGIYGDVSDFEFSISGSTSGKWMYTYFSPRKMVYQTWMSLERYKVDVDADTAIIYKHDGVEVTRGESVVSCNFDQSIYYTLLENGVYGEPDIVGRMITGDSTSYNSSLTWSEVHWTVVRPDLELYVFVEVQVFTDHTPYLEWPSDDIVANYYAWYRGTKVLLSTKTMKFPQTPTLYEYSYYTDMPGFYTKFESRALNNGYTNTKGFPYMYAGRHAQPDGSFTTVGFPLAGRDDSWDNGEAKEAVSVPRFYWAPRHTYDKHLDDEGVILTGSEPYELNRIAYGSAFGRNYAFSPVIEGDGSGWIAPLELYNPLQVHKTYVDHWSWLSASNEINQLNFGISDDSFSAAYPFTLAMLYYHYGVHLGNPQFFGDHLYISIPDVFTTGLVHEFFSGPPEMLAQIKAAVNPEDPDSVAFATTI